MWVLETKPRFLLSTELSFQYPGPHFSCQRRQNEDCIFPPFSIWCVCDHVHRCAHLQKSKDNLSCQSVFAFYLLETVPLVVCYCGCTQRAYELLHPTAGTLGLQKCLHCPALYGLCEDNKHLKTRPLATNLSPWLRIKSPVQHLLPLRIENKKLLLGLERTVKGTGCSSR